MVKKEKKKETKGEEMSIVDIPKMASCRLEIILTVLKPCRVAREKIIIGLDDGGGKLFPSEAKRLAETVMEISRPKFERLFGKSCYPYEVILYMGKEQYILIAPSTEKKDNERWKFDK